MKIAAEYAAIHSQKLRRALPPGFVEDDEKERRPKIAIFFADRHVNAPLRLRRALEFIRDRHRFTPPKFLGSTIWVS